MASAFTLTGFADEIAPSLAEQIACLQATGVDWIEVRSVDGRSILDLSDDQVRELRCRLDGAGIRVSSIGSPVGKIDIGEDLEEHFERFQVALHRAAQLDCSYVRVFSFYHAGQSPAAVRSAVLEQFVRWTAAAAAAGIILLHENEKGIYGDNASRCLDLLTHVASPHLRAAFDAANFVQCGQPPRAAWELLAGHVAYFHIKDAIAASGRVVPAGWGDAEIEPVLRAAAAAGFAGFLSVEHHLKAEDADFGGTGAQRFATAVRALRTLLSRLDAAA